MAKAANQKTPSAIQSALAGVLALVAAYVFASLAIDRGNLAYYGLTLAAIGLGIKYLVAAARSLRNRP